MLVLIRAASPFLSNANVQYINYGNDVTGNTRVQVFSSLHGYSSVDQANVTSSNTSAIANATSQCAVDLLLRTLSL
jgi:hypothetical protein